MKVAAHQTKGGEKKSIAAAHNTGQRKKSAPTASFADNRPKAAAQRRLQAIIQNKKPTHPVDSPPGSPQNVAKQDLTPVPLDMVHSSSGSAQNVAKQDSTSTILKKNKIYLSKKFASMKNDNSCLQGYFIANGATTCKGSEEHFLREQEPIPVLDILKDPTSELKGVRYNVKYNIKKKKPKAVKFFVSMDKSMAINATKNEPKEFYANRKVVNDSNKKLEASESPISLDIKNKKLKIANTIFNKVIPKHKRAQDVVSEDEFSNLFKHECIEVAAQVVGSKFSPKWEGVFQSGTELDTKLFSTSDKYNHLFVKFPQILANYIGTSPDITSPKIKKNLEKSQNKFNMSYGVKSGKGELYKQERMLGINKFALPEVGEGYGIFSTQSGKEKKDYSKLVKPKGFLSKFKKPKPVVRNEFWNYHFAGVVAKAKTDTITLENYNRMPGRNKILAEVMKMVKKDFSQKLLQISTKDEQAASYLIKILGIVTKKNYEIFENMIAQAVPGKAWFFKMYGTQKGQSFHEQQTKDIDNDFLNPITIRVRSNIQSIRNREKKKIDMIPPPPFIRNFFYTKTYDSKIKKAHKERIDKMQQPDKMVDYTLETASKIKKLTKKGAISYIKRRINSLLETKHDVNSQSTLPELSKIVSFSREKLKGQLGNRNILFFQIEMKDLERHLSVLYQATTHYLKPGYLKKTDK